MKFLKALLNEATGIEYQEYQMSDATIYRIPLVTPGMDEYTFDKALNKMFVGDFIKTSSVDGTAYTLLDTQEKVDAYSEGTITISLFIKAKIGAGLKFNL